MPRSKRHVRRNRRPLEKLLPVVLVLLAATVSWRLWQRAHSAAQLLDQAKRTLESKRYAAVEELCKGISLNSPYSAEALLLAAEAASRQDHLRDALAYYDQIQGDAGEQAVSARCAAGEVWLHLGHASKAEAEYRDALTIHPEATVAHERLAGLLALEGRRFESLPHLYELLRQRRHSYDILFLAGQHAKMIEVPDELARLRAAAPDDPAPLIGLARIEMRKQKFEPAAKLLKQVIAQDPGYIEAHALVGRILLEGPDDDELAAWDAALPPDADWHPDIWAVRGGGARRRGEMQAAARCLWEALRRDANHHSATLQLSQVLESLGESKMAEGLGRRAAALSDFAVTLELLFKHPDDLSLIYQAARQAETVGRLWEAWGWNKTALTVASDARWAQEALARIEPQLTDELPPTLALVDPGVQLDLSHYPFPAEHGGTGSTSTPFSPGEASPSFNDIAREAGIDFTYFCGREGTNPRARMFESLGGGIAVVDYDLDGWPDLYFTQGCRWPPRAGQREYLDAMYRNVANGHFSDVTHVSRLGDDRFSQGATVGDFNDDGFPDLYVANIGVNRLYVNNGDGTFSDVGEAAGIYADRWTTSCLLADLNGDGLPDLYDVNYLQGPDVFERTCSVNGEPRTCRPSTFEPAPDMLFFNFGDGRFEEMTESVGLRASGGNGLGIVASNFGSGRLNLFIANDQDANFYFVNRTPSPGGRPLFEERGVLSGLAFDGEGRALASMGVAAGDANGDGKMDLLVTNFSEESSTLYVQEDGESFIDATGPSGLREPSYSMLGFGTQFIDGELDGLPDLVVTNGHIHEFSSPGVSYAMRPQYIRNVGGGRFEERTPSSLGDYFQHAYYGRSLVRLDFNRDGREDFAVSSLETPLALVANQTQRAGHFLAVQLRGVRSSRDAIGAVATILVGRRRQTQWLNAGDGFQASNQRQLVFGLGQSTQVDRLTISWPSGAAQDFTDLAADQELFFVEGSPQATVVPR